MFPAPKNGALRCVTVNGNSMCAPACNNKYDFVFNPPLVYYCSEGEWNSYSLPGQPYVPNHPWPDCAGELYFLIEYYYKCPTTTSLNLMIRVLLNL